MRCQLRNGALVDDSRRADVNARQHLASLQARDGLLGDVDELRNLRDERLALRTQRQAKLPDVPTVAKHARPLGEHEADDHAYERRPHLAAHHQFMKSRPLDVEGRDEGRSRQPAALAQRAATEAKGLMAILPGHPLWGAQADAALARVYRARGFVEAMSLTGRCFISIGEPLFRMAPLGEVRLVAIAPYMQELFDTPHLSRLKVLNLRGNRIDASSRQMLEQRGVAVL